jgi:hypothetical protein
LISATIAKIASVMISAASRNHCSRAESSIPIQQMMVMTAIQITPTKVTQKVLAAAPSAPKRRNVYSPAIWARFAITTTSATMIAQPPIQPAAGPSARAAQVKVVPQSGSTRFMQ